MGMKWVPEERIVSLSHPNPALGSSHLPLPGSTPEFPPLLQMRLLSLHLPWTDPHGICKTGDPAREAAPPTTLLPAPRLLIVPPKKLVSPHFSNRGLRLEGQGPACGHTDSWWEPRVCWPVTSGHGWSVTQQCGQSQQDPRGQAVALLGGAGGSGPPRPCQSGPVAEKQGRGMTDNLRQVLLVPRQ